MALTNRERIDRGLTLLKKGAVPFVERYLRFRLGEKNWRGMLSRASDYVPIKNGEVQWDSQLLISVLWHFWNDVFRHNLNHADRSIVSELRTVRNRHAHEEHFSSEDTDRALDSIRRLLYSCGASAESKEVGSIRKTLLREQFREEARKEIRKPTNLNAQPKDGLKPWREVVVPHSDVASGEYQQAEFAADLAEVHKGDASSEYGDAKEFYSRTFLTEGLKDLLNGALLRISRAGGDPVVELQTNFGGGKTHSMLALYHLFSGRDAKSLSGVSELAKAAGISEIPKANRAVLVGTNMGPAETRKEGDGVERRTIWGEMAWQLGGATGYRMLQESDKRGTNPGKELLKKLLDRFGPCLVLIDEWVAFVRQLYRIDDLSAGSYEANITFAQALTEAAKASKSSLVVATLPVSQIEIGGEAGQLALDSLTNVFRRVAKPWRPASADEGFEIVRRRLFESHIAYPARDAVIKAFGDMYQKHSKEFPSQCREREYRSKLESCYPIHPELFDRLDQDWATLDKFQRTRGVLRLMAAVVHELWKGNDKSLMMMPAHIALDSLRIRSLVGESLPDQWEGVITRDVDGPSSLPQRLDNETPSLCRYSACRRIARTVFMGSAPTLGTNNPGIEDKTLRLGCVQPGESLATFGDALRRLADQATHLYIDKSRCWYALQPSVVRLAKDRAEGFKSKDDEVLSEIVRRLQSQKRKDKGFFKCIHIAPEDGSEVPDEMSARLVILKPQTPHSRKDPESKALVSAKEILERRGNAPRLYRNMLVFLAPECNRLSELKDAVCRYLAWKSIFEEAETLDLTSFAKNQAKTKTEETDRACIVKVPATWSCCLLPHQSSAEKAVEWEMPSLPNGDSLAENVSKRLIADEGLLPELGAPRLKMELDRILWRNVNHINVKRLWEHFASYLYLPRLIGRKTLTKAIEGGFTSAMFCEHFAYATSFDEKSKRYTGLQLTRLFGEIQFDGSSVLVKPEIANEQQKTEKQAKEKETEVISPISVPSDTERKDVIKEVVKSEVEEGSILPHRYFGSVKLSPNCLAQKVGKIAEEVIEHLAAQPAGKVEVTLEIRAEIPKGIDANIQRTIMENSNTLGFENKGFEQT